jgi:hypothetical protein
VSWLVLSGLFGRAKSMDAGSRSVLGSVLTHSPYSEHKGSVASSFHSLDRQRRTSSFCLSFFPRIDGLSL